MKKRRKRPAPPLVLQPHFARFPREGRKARALLDLACFLSGRNLLTDGGSKNLAQGLRGRNGVVSLGLQDVRSYAHGLVGNLLRAKEEHWQTLAEQYFLTYDKGKPRRPTHLQRLYLDWSNDLSWPGLLRASRHHPFLWPEIELALERLEDESLDRTLLSLAVRCRASVEPWEESFESGERAALLQLLPLLPADDFRHRLPWLAAQATRPQDTEAWGFELIRACHLNFPDARSLRDLDFERANLEQVALQHLPESDEFDPVFISAFRSFVTA
ncbi:MAG: hypothetical protein KC800_27390, partial [Candidatus Eremiobacteraeota bacterium]|nr:hypothetical protein [Candidatus Eremiobacteraeota bacterium]